MHRIHYSQDKGFSLIEAMTATALIGILAGLVVPAFNHMMLTNQRSSAAQQVRSLLAYGRSSAVTLKRTVTLCASQDGNSCAKNNVRFFLVFSDSNKDNIAGSGEVLRKEAAASAPTYEITASSLNSFRFRPDGTAISYGNVVLCPSADNRYAAKLIINSMGRVRKSRDTNGDGFIEGPDGNPLNCPN